MSSFPSHWVHMKIGEIAEIVTGKTPSTKKPEYYGGDIPFVKPPDLDAEPPLLTTNDNVTAAGAKTGRLLPEGTITVSCIGILGKIALLGKPGITNQQINSIIPPEGLESKFVYYWAKTLKPWLEQNSSATTVTIINKGRFSTAPIGVPPLNEQRRIVAKIEELTTRSRNAKQALDAIPPLLERFRQSVLAAAFRGDLTKQWRQQNPNTEPASELLKRIRQERRHHWEQDYLQTQKAKGKQPKNDKWKEKYQEPEPVDASDLPELPEGWCWASTSEIAEVQLGRQRSPKNHRGDNMVPYLRAANVTWQGLSLDDVKEMNFSEDEVERFRLSAGDILLGEASGSRYEVGKPGIWENQLETCCFQNTLIRVRSYRPELVPYLYKHFFHNAFNGDFGNASKGTGIHHIGAKKLEQWPVRTPPLPEQRQIVEKVEDYFTSISMVEDVLRFSLLKAERLDQSILAKAFRGELVPQDPNEPASALLARVLADREAAKRKAGK